jgi:hypothetical protein
MPAYGKIFSFNDKQEILFSDYGASDRQILKYLSTLFLNRDSDLKNHKKIEKIFLKKKEEFIAVFNQLCEVDQYGILATYAQIAIKKPYFPQDFLTDFTHLEYSALENWITQGQPQNILQLRAMQNKFNQIYTSKETHPPIEPRILFLRLPKDRRREIYTYFTKMYCSDFEEPEKAFWHATDEERAEVIKAYADTLSDKESTKHYELFEPL